MDTQPQSAAGNANQCQDVVIFDGGHDSAIRI